jgi:hypothetical protein
MQTRLQIGRISTFLFRAKAILEDAMPASARSAKLRSFSPEAPPGRLRVDRVVAVDA